MVSNALGTPRNAFKSQKLAKKNIKSGKIGLGLFLVRLGLVLKYGTDVVPNSQTVVWLGLPESFVHNLALSFAHKHLCR